MRPPWAASAPFQSAPERWSEGAWSTEWRSQPPYHVRSKGRGQASTAFPSAVVRPPPPLPLRLQRHLHHRHHHHRHRHPLQRPSPTPPRPGFRPHSPHPGGRNPLTTFGRRVVDKLRPPFRARWYDLLLLFLFVFNVIFITVIIIIAIVILCNVRVPLLLVLAFAPTRLTLLGQSLCPIGHRVQLGESLADIKTRISRPVGRINRNECDKNTVESRASVPCLSRCCGRVEESFWLRVGCPCFR